VAAAQGSPQLCRVNPLTASFRLIALLIVTTLGLRAEQGTVSPPATEPVRGIVISCQAWGTDAIVEAMKEVKALGANWIQIYPYAVVTRGGGLRIRPWGVNDPPPPWLTRSIAEAHRLGLKICITPHVAPWRTGWGWRGDIAAVCEKTAAPLAYAANWPDYQRVPFWDALDVIALSAYVPVASHCQMATAEEIDRAWQRIRAEALAYADIQYRQIVFMELGYDTGMNAARAPWEDGDGREGGAALQALCLDRALRAVEAPGDDLVGAFLWKWFADPAPDENFLVSAPPMREVVARHWLAPDVSAP